MRIEFADFDITEAAEAKFWSHGIDSDQVYAVLDRPLVVIRNRPGRAASFVLLGRDDRGQCLAIPIMPTDDPHIWRPITAWRCKPSELAKLRQRRSIMESPVNFASPQELLDAEERHVMDSDEWDWDHPVESKVVGVPGAILRLRLSREEYAALSRHAKASGLSTHEFIKRAALAAVQSPVR